MSEDKYKNEISKEEINALPLRSFEGEIKVIESPEDLRLVVEELKGHKLLGFDTETRPAFKKGERYDVSLMQISTESKAFIIKIRKTGIIKELKKLLSDESILKIGVALHDDIKELQSISTFDAKGFLDLGVLARSLKINRTGVRGLAGIFLSARVSKSQQTSNWEKEVLTPAQLVYAATDAWICLMIYNKITDLELV